MILQLCLSWLSLKRHFLSGLGRKEIELVEMPGLMALLLNIKTNNRFRFSLLLMFQYTTKLLIETLIALS
jgi:hypothetical protein